MPGTPQTLPVPPPVSVPTLLNAIRLAAGSGGSGGVAWGSITGTLSAQTDLQTELNTLYNEVALRMPADGGSFSALSIGGFRDTSAAFDVILGFASSSALTAERALTLDVGNVAHTIALGTTASTITFPNAAAITVAGLQIANVFTAAQTVNAGTLTTANLTLTQTWNNAGVTCRGIEYAVTNTNSASDSTIMRLLAGAAGTTSMLAVQANGVLQLNGDTGGSMSRRSDVNMLLFCNVGTGAVGAVGISSGGIHAAASSCMRWTNDSPASTPDIAFYRAAAGVLGLTSFDSTTTGASLQFKEQTAPAAPAANFVRIYAVDNGAGKTQLMALFASGAAQQIAIEP